MTKNNKILGVVIAVALVSTFVYWQFIAVKSERQEENNSQPSELGDIAFYAESSAGKVVKANNEPGGSGTEQEQLASEVEAENESLLTLSQVINDLACEKIDFYTRGFELELESWNQSRGKYSAQEKAVYAGYDFETLEKLVEQNDILAHQVLAKKYFSAGIYYDHDRIHYRAIALGSTENLEQFIAAASIYGKNEKANLKPDEVLRTAVGVIALQYKELSDELFLKDSSLGVDEKALSHAMQLVALKMNNKLLYPIIRDEKGREVIEPEIVGRILKIEEWIRDFRKTNNVVIEDKKPTHLGQYQKIRNEVLGQVLAPGLKIKNGETTIGGVSANEILGDPGALNDYLTEKAKTCGVM